MESYREFEIKNENNEYIYDYDFRTNNLHDANIQEENEKKFDTLLDGILSSNKKIDELS